MARRSPHILLIGLRGSGKSSLGRDLASRTRRRFVDLDEVVPGALGRASVSEVFERDGEEAFRLAETRALQEALAGPASVVALGGGTPTAPGAADRIRAASRDGRAVAVYLRADASTLRARLEASDNAHRPSLTGVGVLDEVDALLERRDPLYRDLADAIVSTDGLTEAETLDLLQAVSDEPPTRD